MSAPLLLQIAPESVIADEVGQALPCHALVLEPLIRSVGGIRVVESGRSVVNAPDLSGTPEPRWVWDYPAFWNSGGGARGSIILEGGVPLSNALAAVLHFCEYGGRTSERQCGKSCGRKTVSHCRRLQDSGGTALALSASNGIELLFCWLQDDAAFEELMLGSCRRFVRAAAEGTYEKEIIWNRPPYSQAATSRGIAAATDPTQVRVPG